MKNINIIAKLHSGVDVRQGEEIVRKQVFLSKTREWQGFTDLDFEEGLISGTKEYLIAEKYNHCWVIDISWETAVKKYTYTIRTKEGVSIRMDKVIAEVMRMHRERLIRKEGVPFCFSLPDRQQHSKKSPRFDEPYFFMFKN